MLSSLVADTSPWIECQSSIAAGIEDVIASILSYCPFTFKGMPQPCSNMHVLAQMEAEIALLRVALQDPSNTRFVLLSETCAPLYPATLVWAQLQGEHRSRLNACANPLDPNDDNNRMAYRCLTRMRVEILLQN